mmetsp:Transcript_26219/g.43898  ORF Transcript_26219/g.43898 Transcript_26219/m.43898 type:complete len:265 (+) Transcript_26219:374-1168(+)
MHRKESSEVMKRKESDRQKEKQMNHPHHHHHHHHAVHHLLCLCRSRDQLKKRGGGFVKRMKRGGGFIESLALSPLCLFFTLQIHRGTAHCAPPHSRDASGGRACDLCTCERWLTSLGELLLRFELTMANNALSEQAFESVKTSPLCKSATTVEPGGRCAVSPAGSHVHLTCLTLTCPCGNPSVWEVAQSAGANPPFSPVSLTKEPSLRSLHARLLRNKQPPSTDKPANVSSSCRSWSPDAHSVSRARGRRRLLGRLLGLRHRTT